MKTITYQNASETKKLDASNPGIFERFAEYLNKEKNKQSKKQQNESLIRRCTIRPVE